MGQKSSGSCIKGVRTLCVRPVASSEGRPYATRERVTVLRRHQRIGDGGEGLGREVEPVIDPALAQRIRQLDSHRGCRVVWAICCARNRNDGESHQHRVVGLDHLGASQRVSHLAAAGASLLGYQQVDGRVVGTGHRVDVEAHLDRGKSGRQRYSRFTRATGGLPREDPLVTAALDARHTETVTGQSRERGPVVVDADDDPSSSGQGLAPRGVEFAPQHVHSRVVDLIDGGRIDHLGVAHRRGARTGHERILHIEIGDHLQWARGRLGVRVTSMQTAEASGTSSAISAAAPSGGFTRSRWTRRRLM